MEVLTAIFICLVSLNVRCVISGANNLHFEDGASSAEIIAGDVFFEILDPPSLRYSYRIRPAKDFGAPFDSSVSFKNARLVPTVPIHSCKALENGDDISGHIALAQRGECSFVYKTAMAQLAGARAIIITESIDKLHDSIDIIIEMVDDNRVDFDVNIPAAFLIGRSGSTILTTLQNSKRKYAIINLPVNMTHVHITKMNQPPWIEW